MNMKKIMIFILVAFAAILILPSCKKDYTCTCKVDKQKYIYTYNNELKKEAQNACDEQDKAAKLEDKSGSCSLSKNED
jgi:hypothetical protein